MQYALAWYREAPHLRGNMELVRWPTDKYYDDGIYELLLGPYSNLEDAKKAMLLWAWSQKKPGEDEKSIFENKEALLWGPGVTEYLKTYGDSQKGVEPLRNDSRG
jgi:hypothetical protein